LFLSSTTFGIIPAGTGNGFVKSLTEVRGEEFGTLQATYAIVKGERKLMDLIEIELEYLQNEPFTKIYSFLCISWAILSDIDINSDVLRNYNMGHARYVLWGTYRFLFVREYPGQLFLKG